MFSPGAGGKVVRERRRALPALPYSRPENLLPPQESGNPKWFSGIISGAGRLISSVFRSESEESSSSSSSDGGEGRHQFSGEDENDKDDAQDFQQLHERAEGSQLEIRWSETKLAIKHLLLQETFSRDESDALIEIIQSRIVESREKDSKSGEGTEIPEKSVYKDLNFLGTWRSMNKGKKFPEGLEYSSNYTNEHLGYSQDLCEKAVMEAKQWLDKKRLESTPKSEPDLGPCTLNTEVKWEDGADSPIDIARTYMKTRPPWQSPIMRGIGSKTPPSGLLLLNELTPSSLRTDMILSASLEHKPRSYLFSEVHDSRADSSYHDAHQNADDIDPTVSIISSVAFETSKLLDAPGTPENLCLDYSGTDMASCSPGRGATLANASTSVPPRETSKPADNSLNGEVNNPCPTNQTPDLKLESASIDAPNFILVNDKIQKSSQADVEFVDREVLSSKATNWMLTTSEESSADRCNADQTPIGIKQYKRSLPKPDNKYTSAELRSQNNSHGQHQEPVNGSSSDPHVDVVEGTHNLVGAQNGSDTRITEDLLLARPAGRRGRPKRVAVKARRGRGRGK